MKQTPLLRLGILALFVFWSVSGVAQDKDDPAQLKAQIDQLTKVQVDIALTIQQADPADIPKGSSPQAVYSLAATTLQDDLKTSNEQRVEVDKVCHRTVAPEELAAATSACNKVLVPFNERLDKIHARAVQLKQLSDLTGEIKWLRIERARIQGLLCPDCAPDDKACWERCFDGSRNHDGAVNASVGTPFFSTEAKAERDRIAIQEYLNSGSVPTTGVKVWSKPPPSPNQ
jgi:hypothetical protein